MVLMLLSCSLVMAEDASLLDNELVLEELSKVVGMDVPNFLQFVGDDDIINVYDMDGDFLLGCLLEDRKIKGFLATEEKSDLDVNVEFTTALKIYKSDNPIGEFMEAKENGEIVFETKNWLDSLKLNVSLAALNVYGWFY